MSNMIETALEKLVQPAEGAADVIFRIGTALIFIVGGLGHFFQADLMLARIADSPWAPAIAPLGDPLLLLHLSGAVFVVAGISLILGFSTRLSALALFVTLIPITWVVHIAPGHTGPLFKNIAILSALAFIFIRGAGCCAIDGMLKRTRTGIAG